MDTKKYSIIWPRNELVTKSWQEIMRVFCYIEMVLSIVDADGVFDLGWTYYRPDFVESSVTCAAEQEEYS